MNMMNMNIPMPLWYDLEFVNTPTIAAHPTMHGIIVIGPIKGCPNSE